MRVASDRRGRPESPAESVAVAVHAINNPIFAILGLLEFLLAEAEAGSRSHERLELIRESALEIKEAARALHERSLAWDRDAP